MIFVMIKNRRLWQKVDLRIQAGVRPTYLEALKIFNSLYEEARKIGHFRRPPTLKGLEGELRWARALSSLNQKQP